MVQITYNPSWRTFIVKRRDNGDYELHIQEHDMKWRSITASNLAVALRLISYMEPSSRNGKERLEDLF